MALILSGGATDKKWVAFTNDANYGYWYSDELTGEYERTSNEISKTFSFGTITTTYNDGLSKITCPAGCTIYTNAGKQVSDGETEYTVRSNTGTGGTAIIFAP